ncbi:MAG TPA: Na/Pi symporter [Candidatus Acidoferrales bacterium]|nr:Na/Pi symporter [Candidatus Acidoferrales bacterium]
MGDILGPLIGGIGAFFVGLRLIAAGLKQMTGRRLRVLFARWTERGWRAGLIGLAFGFVSQSMAAVSFIVASLVATGMMTVRKALPVVFWANGGGGLLVLIAVLDVKLIVFVILGLAGLSYAFERPKRYHSLAGTLFGIGLLFYGLLLIRTGAAPLAEKTWFQAALLEMQSSLLLEFLVSAVLTAIAQSSSAVAILAITFAQSGLLSVEQTMMAIYGANFGSGMITWILAHGLHGRPKQLVMAQVLFNCIASAVFVPLFYLEMYGAVPLVRAFVGATPSPLPYQMAYVYLLFNVSFGEWEKIPRL